MKRKWKLCLVIGLCLLFSCGFFLCELSATANATRTLTVVLDAGHGGIDCGVLGLSTGVKESDISLAIVKKLRAFLRESGVNTVLTRSTDAGLYGVVGDGMKKRDMQSRKRIIDNASPVAVVSVHQNSYPQNRSHCGGQVFYRAESEKGELLAAAIQKQLNAVNPFRQDRTIHAGDYYMLNCTDAPSVIVECGFLTNEAEEKLLQTEEYQAQVAGGIAQGVLSFLAVETGKTFPI